MSGKALSVEEIVDGRHPLRSVVGLLRRRPRRILAAVAFFAVKDTPLWFLPVVTAEVIDIVVAGGPSSGLLLWSVIALVLLASGVFRSVGFTAYNTLQFADVPPERLGAANALSSITGQLAVGLGVALTALVVRIADGLLGTTGVGDPTGYRIALIVLAALALVSIVEGLRLPRGTGASLRAAPR